jgi:hypothetical protein
LPKRLRQCADFIAANSDRIAVSTVADLAAGADVPPSALMRFCQIIGFSGFSEMQKLFRDAYSPSLPDYGTRLENLKSGGAGSPARLLGEFIESGRLSLESLAKSVDEAALEQAVNLLAHAGTLHIVGYRRAFPVASYLSYVFEKLNIPAMLHDGAGKLDHAHALRSGDALIAITFAPYSPETLDLAAIARARGGRGGARAPRVRALRGRRECVARERCGAGLVCARGALRSGEACDGAGVMSLNPAAGTPARSRVALGRRCLWAGFRFCRWPAARRRPRPCCRWAS